MSFDCVRNLGDLGNEYLCLLEELFREFMEAFN